MRKHLLDIWVIQQPKLSHFLGSRFKNDFKQFARHRSDTSPATEYNQSQQASDGLAELLRGVLHNRVVGQV